MRKFLTGFLFIFSTTAFVQAAAETDTITFCSVSFKIPDGCTTKKNGINCNNFEMSWSYMDEINVKGLSYKEKLKFSEDAFIELSNMLKKFKRKRFTCYLLGNKVKGYKVTYKADTETNSIIYVSGFINGRAVTVFMTLKREVNTIDDFPEFPKQIMQLTQ